MTLDNGQTIGIEKNQRVNVAAAGFPTAGLEASNMSKINFNIIVVYAKNNVRGGVCEFVRGFLCKQFLIM